MANGNERFGYSDASRAEREIGLILRDHGMDRSKVKQMVVLGSGLGDFADGYMDAEKAWQPSGPVKIPFNQIYGKFNGGGVEMLGEGVPGHDRSLIIGPLNGSTDGSLVMAQSGREHPYEGVSTRRSTFWLRVAQLMGVQDLIGSNAAGILTPQTLKKNALMLMHSDMDFGGDNPLIGQNNEDFGPRFPHRADSYPVETRDIVKRLAEEMGIALDEGTYVRVSGPNYESTEDVYRLRHLVEEMWYQGRVENDPRFQKFTKATVGMSSTFENMVAQHASQSERYPAFQNRAYLSVATNYAAMLGPDGLIKGEVLKHAHVKQSADEVKNHIGRLVQGVLLELRKKVA